MENITVFKNVNGIEYVIIDNGNEQFTSMTKEYFDAQQANSTPSVAPVVTPVDPVAATAAVVTPTP